MLPDGLNRLDACVAKCTRQQVTGFFVFDSRILQRLYGKLPRT